MLQEPTPSDLQRQILKSGNPESAKPESEKSISVIPTSDSTVNQCTICLESIHSKVTLILPCNHVFHQACYPKGDPRLSKNCANCRTPIIGTCDFDDFLEALNYLGNQNQNIFYEKLFAESESEEALWQRRKTIENNLRNISEMYRKKMLHMMDAFEHRCYELEHFSPEKIHRVEAENS
jgi:hypothetical protein